MAMQVPDLATLSIEAVARDETAAPCHRWNPPLCGSSGMRIAADGSWWHDGAPIARPALVRLFASILRRESNGGYVLVTPAEKLSIVVDDAPFVAVEVTAADGRLAFRLNTDALVIAGPCHPIRLAGPAVAPRPYLTVRDGIEARIARPAYYALAELALAGGDTPPGVWSDGAFFALAAG